MISNLKEIVDAPPRREMSLFDEVDRVFDTFLDRGWLRPRHDWWPEVWPEETAKWYTPRVDVVDRAEEVLVRAEVPGVEKEDLDIDVSGRLLTVSGERRWEDRREEGEYFRSEIACGAFSRTIRLPEDVEIDKAKAEFKEGILAIHLPKTHKTEYRRIVVE